MDAIIEVDGKPLAKGVYEGSFPVGTHRVRISAPNRETHEALVEVTDGTTKQLEPAPLSWTLTSLQTSRSLTILLA